MNQDLNKIVQKHGPLQPYFDQIPSNPSPLFNPHAAVSGCSETP